MRCIGKGIGTLAIAAMVIGVAHFAPNSLGGIGLAATVIGIVNMG